MSVMENLREALEILNDGEYDGLLRRLKLLDMHEVYENGRPVIKLEFYDKETK